MSGILQLGYDYGNNRTAAISVDANGKLDVDVELNTSGLATSANQTNGTQQTICLGNNSGVDNKPILVSATGVVQTLDSEVFGKTAQIANQTTLSNTNEAAIIANQTNGTQQAKCMGITGAGGQQQLKVEADGSTIIGGGAVKTAVDNLGATQHILVDAQGHLQVDVLSGGGGGTQFAGEATLASTGTGTAMIGRDSGNVARLVATDTSGNLQIDIVGNSDTTKATSTNQTTAIGHLSEIEGAVETLELCVSSNEMVINNKNAKPSNLVKNSVVSSSTGNTTPILDTEGYRSIIIIGKTDSTSASWNIEWSDASDFAGGTDIIYNTDSPGGLSAFTPLAFTGALSSDSALSYIQGISIISQIPQRHMRIRVFNTSGSNRDYTFFYQLSN
jgi:hypothetical protein